MDRLPFTSSESEESDSTAQHRWESEGGNPGQLRQLLGNKKEEITTDGARASDLVIAVSRKANDTVLQAVPQGHTCRGIPGVEGLMSPNGTSSKVNVICISSSSAK